MKDKLTEDLIIEFRSDLLSWYKQNGRDLPWRHTTDPYHIWVSEIMLQQTQVETVKSYYKRFIERFPTVDKLATAPIDDVYKLWEGLGYYRRAANMQQAAITIHEDMQDIFPDTYEMILKLKGIGAYTASAISSIAFGLPKGVVDGNTLRIISRIYNRQDNIALQQTKNAYQVIMDQLIDPEDPSSFNQAMMDIGATVCTPKHPSCDGCPIKKYCEANHKGTQAILPVNNKPRKKDEIELITALIEYKDQYLLIKGEDGLLSGLHGLIQYEASSPAAFEEMFFDQYGIDVRLIDYAKTVKHVFTHKVWIMNSYYGRIHHIEDSVLAKHPELKFYTKEAINDIAISTAHKKVIKLFII